MKKAQISLGVLFGLSIIFILFSISALFINQRNNIISSYKKINEELNSCNQISDSIVEVLSSGHQTKLAIKLYNNLNYIMNKYN